MIQIRRGVFETNSSSTHSICICSKTDYEKFIAGELWYSRWTDDLVTRQQINERIHKFFPDKNMEDYTVEELEDDGFYSFDSYNEKISEWYEMYDVEYTTPGGETIVAFGYYGHD